MGFHDKLCNNIILNSYNILTLYKTVKTYNRPPIDIYDKPINDNIICSNDNISTCFMDDLFLYSS